MIVGNGNDLGCAKLASTASQYLGRFQPSRMDHWVHRRSQDEHHHGCRSGSQGSCRASMSGNDVGVDVVQHQLAARRRLQPGRQCRFYRLARGVRRDAGPDDLPGQALGGNTWRTITGAPPSGEISQYAHGVAETAYAKCGDLSLAYQVFGGGPIELVFVGSFVTHIELWWTIPEFKAFFDQLARFCRVVVFDKVGVGLSDPVPHVRTVDDRSTEIEAVMDAVGFGRAPLFSA